MADKQKKKNLVAAAHMPVPECPICRETMCAPIWQCQTGHSLCNNCNGKLTSRCCPYCHQPMTGMRNFQLEDLLGQMKLHCPNKPCVYAVKSGEMDDHLKECIFRVMDCPLGLANGKCSWNGMLKDILTHFEERHPSSTIKLNENINLNNIKVNEDERILYLANMGKYLFIVTFRIDTLQKLSYFVVQHIGSRFNAHNYTYEIHLTSAADNRRQLVFKDHCVSDVTKVEEVFQSGKCAMIPLPLLQHFIKNRTVGFRLWIGRPGPQRAKEDVPHTSRSASPKPDFKEKKHNVKPKERSHSKGPNPKSTNKSGFLKFLHD